MSRKIFIGTDSGATTTKFSAVWENGEAVTTKLLQRPTNAQNGRDGGHRRLDRGHRRISGAEQLEWPQVAGVGLAIPGTL